MTTFRLGTTTVEHGHLTSQQNFLLEADALKTHGIILGQTGSGKTGLGISLLEEAAIAGIPCIAVDPKGDLGNLLLQFPDCNPEDFADWSDEPDAAAEDWREGLGADRSRITDLLKTTDLRIFTPGSTRGWPIAILKDLSPPGVQGEDLHRLVQAETVGLLELAGVKCDPVSGAEATLISSIIERYWVRGNTLPLSELVGLVTKPPFKKIGALSVEAACSKRKRKVLAQKLNALITSPAMRSWSAGEDLDIDSLLRSDDGRPRISILSIAHLGDAERMFFLTKLLSELVAWMRQQSGSIHLKALLYIDEVFGYLPPVKNPPTKDPMLLLLKQARAFGLGVVLASQNPIDVDYRALSNLGTWMLGRLQTERDINRVIDGLRAAAAEQGEDLEVADLRATMAGLPKRTFLVRSPGTPGCQLVKTRHTLSYLRGPMTLDEIARVIELDPEVPRWGPPRDLEEVLEELDDLDQEGSVRQVIGENIDALIEDIQETEENASDLMVRAAAGSTEALALCRTIPPGEVERARARVSRLNENIRRSNKLIDDGQYKEAHAVWSENPVMEQAVIVADSPSELEEKIEKELDSRLGSKVKWIVAGVILGWAIPIAILMLL